MKALTVAVAIAVLLPPIGYLGARMLGMHRVSPARRDALRAPLEVVQQQATALDAQPFDATRVCALNSAALLADVPCDVYIARVRSQLASFPGATLDATTISGDPARERIVRIGCAAAGPRGAGEFAVELVRDGADWRIQDVLKYGASIFPAVHSQANSRDRSNSTTPR